MTNEGPICSPSPARHGTAIVTRVGTLHVNPSSLLRIRAPLRQAGLLQVRCRRADATTLRCCLGLLVDCAAYPAVCPPASPPAVQPTSSRRRGCVAHQRHFRHSLPSRACHIGGSSQMLCSSKGSDGRSEAVKCNAALLQLEAFARPISCRVTPCYPVPRLCITQLQAEGDQEPPFAFRHRPSSSLLRGLTGGPSGGSSGPQLPQGHRDFSGHGHMGTSHLITGPSATSSRIAVGFPACSAAESKQAAPGNDEPVRVSLATARNRCKNIKCQQSRSPAVGAITFSFCYFAHSGRPRDRSDSSSNTLMPV